MSELNEYMEYLKIQQEILSYLKPRVKKAFGSFKDVGVETREHYKNDKLKAIISRIEQTTLKDIDILRAIHNDIFIDNIFDNYKYVA